MDHPSLEIMRSHFVCFHISILSYQYIFFSGTSFAKITISGTENPREEADRLNSRLSEIKTPNIKLEKATDGSLILYVTFIHKLLESNSSLNRELNEFIRVAFDKGQVLCHYSKECNIILSIGQGMYRAKISISKFLSLFYTSL